MLRALAAAALLVACSKSQPPEGTTLLQRTHAAVDAVCACKDAACRSRELAVYEALVAEIGPTNVSAAVVEELAREAERVAKCSPATPAERP